MNASKQRKLLAGIGLIITGAVFGGAAFGNDDGNVLYLSEYLHGDFYYAPLGDIDRSDPPLLQPIKLQLPVTFRAKVELGNHDVSPDGKSIVFAARKTTDYDWNIYRGDIDLRKKRIRKLTRIIRNVGVRDEDPRYSWDGRQIVYKCGGNVCIYPELTYASPVVTSWCELWAPSFGPTGYAITYTKRCAGSSDDKIWQFDLLTETESALPSAGGATDRFSQFLDDGRIVFSRFDAASGRSSLWVHDSGVSALLHDRTQSDDDLNADKHDRNHIAFIGWQDDGYDLYVYRVSRGDSVKLTEGRSVLWPVLFRSSERPRAGLRVRYGFSERRLERVYASP